MVAYPQSFAGQFILGRQGEVAAPAGAEVHRLASLELATIGIVPRIRVLDADSRQIGMMLGHPVDYAAGRVISGELRLGEAYPDPAGLDGFIEREIYRFSGPYLFILDHGATRRLYMDAGASMSAVFDAGRRLCAATAGLLLTEAEYVSRFRADLYEHLRVLDDGWFPAGLTAHAGIDRILCNHYFDFEDGKQHRHWPRGPIPAAADPDQACATINRVVAATMKALLTAGSVATTLTAGSETRMVLAACRDTKDQLRLFTIDGVEGASLDAVRAAELARAFGLNHSRLPVVYADEDAVEQWRARCGHCIGGANMRTFPTVEPMAAFSFFTGGVGGEAGRGFFWRPTDALDTLLDGHSMAARLGMPIHDEVVAALDAWLQSVPPDLDLFQTLDLGFLEHRLGAWGFVQSYATPEVLQVQPLVARENFIAMLSLPTDWRRANRMVTRCIELAWPELLRLPINRYGDYRDLGRPLMRALRNPRLILRKLRKRFG